MRRLKQSGDEGGLPAVMSWRSEEGEIVIRLFLRHHRSCDLYCVQENATSCLQVEHGDLQTARWPG